MSAHINPDWGEQPVWDAATRELRVGDSVVKWYRIPAPNQERILAAFQEEGWPPHIDDPLAPADDINPKYRLHDAIQSLNRNQRVRRIRFLGNGRGDGVQWKLVEDG